MRSAVLVSRILRVLETDGALGDGAALASAYADAVAAANRRLEEVDLALIANQGSEAMRLVEESPRLFDEVGALDFVRFPEWSALCAERGWARPAAIDQARVEKILDASRSATMVEPALKRYRKAMRTNDPDLLLQSLRSLADADKSQDWAGELRKAEAAAQAKLLAAFRKAVKDEDADAVEKTVADLLDGAWSAPPDERVAAEPLAWRKRRDEERRKREMAEDLSLLRDVQAAWKRPRAESLLNHLDRLRTFGVPVPKESDELIESVRARCARERAEAEAQARWDAAMERLRIAVGRGVPEEIQDALGDEAFGDRDPEEDVRERAEETLRRFEDAHRRKVRFLAGCLLLALCGILALAGYAFSRKQYEARCLSAVARLQRIGEAPKAHEALAAALSTLETDDPKVRRDPRIRAFDDRLREIVDAREARLSDAERKIAALGEADANGWPEDGGDWESAIEDAGALLLAEDVELRNRLGTLELAYRKTKSDRDLDFRGRATRTLAALERQSEALVSAIGTAFSTGPLLERVERFNASATAWKSENAEKVPDLVPRLDVAWDGIREAVRSMKEADEALAAFRGASTLDEFLTSRQVLRTAFSDRAGIAHLVDLPASDADIRMLAASELPNQRRFDAEDDAGMSEDDFAEFLESNIFEYEDHDNWYSQYAVETGNAVVILAEGKADINDEKKQGDKWVVIRGTLFDLMTLSAENMREKKGVQFKQKLSALCLEYREVVDQAKRRGITAERFSDWLFDRMQKLLEDGQKTYEEEMRTDERLSSNRLTAYGRVRIMTDYLDWLDEMGFTSSERGAPGADTFAKIREKASDISIDNADSAFVWACLKDNRVSARNRECAELLKRMPPDFFKKVRSDIKRSKRFAGSIGTVAEWTPAFVGTTRFSAKKPGVSGFDLTRADATKPVYVVRQENGGAFLKRAFLPKDGWKVAHGMMDNLVPGEPLFQVRWFDKTINPDAEVAKILESAPPGGARQFERKNFWIELAK